MAAISSLLLETFAATGKGSSKNATSKSKYFIINLESFCDFVEELRHLNKLTADQFSCQSAQSAKSVD